MRTRLVAGAALSALLASCAINTRYKPKGQTLPYEGFFATFPSGMRLVVYEMPYVDRFMFAASYRAGGVDDPRGREGLAHLVEHLTFRAEPQPGGARIWDRLVASGLRFNAFTSMDETVYWEVGKPADLPAVLALEAARMRGPLTGVSDDEFAVERDVVLSEYRERFETDPEGAEVQWILQAAFPGHAYGRPIGGDPASLARIAPGDVRRWVKERYRPEGAVLVLVSPRPARQAAEAVAAAFGELTGSGGPRLEPLRYEPPAMPPPPSAPALEERKAPVEQPHLWIAWTVPGYYSRRVPHGFAASANLERVLHQRIRDRTWRDVIDDFGVYYLPFDGAGVILARFDLVDARDAPRVLEMARYTATGIRKGAVMRAAVQEAVRDRLLVEAYLSLEQLDAPAVSRFLRATGTADYLKGWRELVAAQLRFDVTDYADEFLAERRAVPLLVVPDGNALARDVGGGRGRRVHQAFDPLEDDASGLPPPDAEAVRAALRAPGLDRAGRRTLGNGLEVAALKHGALPVAQVQLAFRTRAQGTPEVPVGLPRMAFEATSPFFMWEKNRLTGALPFWRIGTDDLMLGERGASGNLDVLIEAEASWATNLHIGGWDDLRLVKARRQATRDARPDRAATRRLVERLFPGHAYGAWPDAEVLASVPGGRAQEFLDRQIRPERASLLVVSDQEASPELWSWIEEEFGGWSRGERPPRSLPVPAEPTRRSVTLVDRPGASQAVVTVGLRAPPVARRDGPAHEALRWLLRSRLTRRLRVEEGVSYGVHVFEIDHREASALVVSAAVDRQAAGRGLAYALESVRVLAGQPVPAARAARARWQVARSFAFRFDTVAENVAALDRMAVYGLPPDHYEGQPASIASLDAGRIQAAAGSLSVGREVAVIQGDAATLLPQLRAAGFEVEVVKPPAAPAR